MIKRVPIGGGEPTPIHESRGALASAPQGLTWPTPETILFADAEGVVRVPANGGATEVLVPRGDGERFFSPQLLPGGKSVLFTRLPGEPGAAVALQGGQVVVQSIGGNDRKVVWDGGSAARYLPSGHLVYAQGTTLFAIAFDAKARTVRGEPVQMAQGVRRGTGVVTDAAQAAIADAGTLALIRGSTADTPGEFTGKETTLVWVDREGHEEPLPVRRGDYTGARISPDGKKIALVVGFLFQQQDRPPHIWLFDLTTGNLSLLTGDMLADGPVWSSDSSRIFFSSPREGGRGIYAVEVATGKITLVGAQTSDVPNPYGWSISPDDHTLALTSSAGGDDDLHLATLALKDGRFARLLHGEETEFAPSISPNGAWLAYRQGLGAGGTEIDLRPFPDVSRTRIPVGLGESPVFSRDGSELFFLDGQGGLAVAAVAYEPTLRVGAPQKLFEAKNYLMGPRRTWDVDPTDKRFLMIRQPNAPAVGAQPSPARIDVVVNWFEELKRKVPTTN